MQGVLEPGAPVPMVASGKSTIFNDPWANPRTGAGTKAPPEAPPYDENSYEPEDTEDGSSFQWRGSPSEFRREPQVRDPSAGQHADNLWAKTMHKDGSGIRSRR